MALQDKHERQLNLALDEEICVRRLPVHSSHWKQPPIDKPTSKAYDDLEVSVNLHSDEQTAESLNANYNEIIREKGVGFSTAKVKLVRDVLVANDIQGNVWKDPEVNNVLHGIITGPKNKRKRESLRDNFIVQIKPKSPSEVFGN